MRPCMAASRPAVGNRRPVLRCRAEEGGKSDAPSSTPPPAEAPPKKPSASNEKPAEGDAAQQPAVLQKGQGMAVVTGGISILFGVAYLALVYLMDSRGGQMQPPPPEAFM